MSEKKKSHKKLWIILSIILVATIFFAYPTKDNSKIKNAKYKEDEQTITRYEFAKLLCEQYGLINNVEDKQFYKDVPSSNKYYHSVELAYACGLLPKTDTFQGNKKVTAEYAATASMKALCDVQVQHILKTSKKLNDKDYFRAAKTKHLVSWKWTKLTKGQCKDLIDKVKKIFTETAEVKDNYINIDYAKDVQTIPNSNVLGTNNTFSTIYLKNADNITIGSVINCTEPIFEKTIIGTVTAIQRI